MVELVSFLPPAWEKSIEQQPTLSADLMSLPLKAGPEYIYSRDPL